jgi:hypothetical protein
VVVPPRWRFRGRAITTVAGVSNPGPKIARPPPPQEPQRDIRPNLARDRLSGRLARPGVPFDRLTTARADALFSRGGMMDRLYGNGQAIADAEDRQATLVRRLPHNRRAAW